MVPTVEVSQSALEVPRTFVGAASRVPLSLANTSAVPATLEVDLLQNYEWQLGCTR